MRPSRTLPVAAVCALLGVAGSVHPVAAVPTCPGSDRTVCGGRIIPEPAQSAGFLTYNEWTAAMSQLQREHPNRVRFDAVGRTFGGRPVYEVLVTDFADPSPLSARTGLYFNGDIHGDERDGTEGFARVVEDLAESTDPNIATFLRHEVLVFTDANPDGWQCGDVPDGLAAPGGDCSQAQANEQSGTQIGPSLPLPPVPEFTRHNSADHDLNREWPVVGFQNPDTFPLGDPEVQSLVAAHGNLLHRRLGVHFAYGMDVHGSAMPETPPSAQLMLDVLLSAGEFDLTRSLEQTQLWQTYMDNLRATASGDVLANIGQATQEQVYKVGDWATSWDIYGYLVSGGYADWQANQDTGLGAVTGTVELWINGEPGQENTFTGYNQLIEASNVHAMRVAVSTVMNLASRPQQASLRLPGPVAYIADRFALGAADDLANQKQVGDPATRPPGRPYPASVNRFFDDLAPMSDQPVVHLDGASVRGEADLRRFTTVVIPQDAHLDDHRLVDALRSYARDGGTIVLTDGALRDLVPLGIVPAGAVAQQAQYAGFVDSVQGDALTQGVRFPLGRQTYEPVPIGYKIDNTFSSSSSVDTAPVWTVDQTAWEAGGGRTAGTTGSGRTSLGEVRYGQGAVRILGALLPDPTGAYGHPFGVADYAVTYTGYTLFVNLIGGHAALERAQPSSPAVLRGGVRGAAVASIPNTAAPSGAAGRISLLLLLAALPLLAIRVTRTAHYERPRSAHRGDAPCSTASLSVSTARPTPTRRLSTRRTSPAPRVPR
jgi:hypothetical protein